MSKFWIRSFGIAGIIGGLMLFGGDMLFYYDSGSTNLKLNMAHSSDTRIMANGLIALFSTWFYLLGLGQVYYAFQPTTRKVKVTVLVTFAGILISYGIVHAAYIAIATTAKLALLHSIDLESATALASETNQLIRLIIYPIFAVLSAIFIWQVWQKKTHYPRWMVFFFPLLPFLLNGFICGLLSGSLWIIISGGYLNLILVLFFTASTIALWEPNQK